MLVAKYLLGTLYQFTFQCLDDHRKLGKKPLNRAAIASAGCTTGTAQAQILVFHVLSRLDLTCLFLSSSARISSTFQSLGLVSYIPPILPFQVSLSYFNCSLFLFDFPSRIPFRFPYHPSLCRLKQAGVSSSS